MKWNKAEIEKNTVRELSGKYDVDLLTASILVRRGVTEPEQIKFYLEDDLMFSHNPFLFTEMEDVVDRIQQAAVQVCALLGCRGAARVDFMVRKREFFCLEINTIPGMTETSLLPKAAGHARIPFSELVQRMLEDAGLDK